MYIPVYEESVENPTMKNDPTENTCKLSMFDETYFRGESQEITGEVEILDFNTINFDDSIASLKIEGNCCWIFYTDANFQGESFTFQKGEYKSATQIKDIFKKASSVTSKC